MKRNSFNLVMLLLLVSVAVMQACQNPMGRQPITESPTMGNIRISVDESFQLLFEAELYTFQSLYENAKIAAAYKPEADVLRDFMNDSVRTIVVTRDLTQQEKEYLMAGNFIPRSAKVAHDALALIVNPANNDTLIAVNQFADILRGKISTWKDLNPKSAEKTINVVFDNNKSGNVRYFRERFNLTGDFPANCFAVNSNQEVMNYVKNNPNALGIISVNWISDEHDSITINFLNAVKVVEIGDESNSYCKPYQGYIAEESYPFCRDVYMITRESFSGLGKGFMSFVAGDQGQRIVRRSGLVPATMPLRLIEIHRD